MKAVLKFKGLQFCFLELNIKGHYFNMYKKMN